MGDCNYLVGYMYSLNSEEEHRKARYNVWIHKVTLGIDPICGGNLIGYHPDMMTYKFKEEDFKNKNRV